MIDPDSPIVTAALAAHDTVSGHAPGYSLRTDLPRIAMVAALEAAIAEWQRQQGPLAALALGAINLPGRSE